MKVLIVAATLVAAASAISAPNVQSSLRRSLFADYDSMSKPDGQVKVQVGVTPLNLGWCPVKNVSYLSP